MHIQSHHVVGLIEIDPQPSQCRSLGDRTLAATLSRLAVCASADFESAAAEEPDDLDESLDAPSSDDAPLLGEPWVASAPVEAVAVDMPRLLCELSLLYTMVRGDALLRRFAAR